MRGTLSITRRELASLFRVPVGWVVIALYLLVTGVVFQLFTVRPGEVASMRSFFELSAMLLFVVAPAVSMRLFSEEFRSGTIESLMTAPVGDLAMVTGKYLGAVAFLVAMLAPTLSYVGVLALIADGRLDPGPIVAGYASLLLAGMMYLAVGTLISTLTASQTLAFLGTFLALLGLLVGPGLAGPRVPEPFSSWVFALSIGRRVEDLAKGVIDLAHLAFFLGLAGFFLMAAYVSLSSRRWR